MDAIFIQALAKRAKVQADLLNKLPEDVKLLVVKEMEAQNDQHT
jgi:hypothetical protein